MGTTNILDLNNRVSALEKAVSGGDSNQANKADIATEFNTTTAYTAGCFVYHNGKLYIFNVDHAAGAWDASEVAEANVTDEVTSNKAAIDTLDTRVDDIDDTLQHVYDTEILYSTTADGVKTYSEILDTLYDYVTAGCELVMSSTVFYYTGGRMFFSGTIDNSNYVYESYLRVKQSASQYIRIRIKNDGTLTYTDMSANVPSSGIGFIVSKQH